MEQIKDIVAQIRSNYERFSKSHKKIADYILACPDELTMMSINQLSQKTGVSPATITRFTHLLEFHGYPELQRSLYEYHRQCAPFGQLKSLLRTETAEKPEETDELSWNVRQNIQLLEDMLTPQLQESYLRVRDIVLKARNIYVAGMRSSYTIAYYLGFMLQRMFSNVRLLPLNCTDLPNVLCDVGDEDCLIMVSYSRYTRISDEIATYFQQCGSSVISITDSITSPIALKSKEVLVAPNGDIYSPVAAITLCNCLITSLGRHSAQDTLKRMELQDEIALAHNVYL